MPGASRTPHKTSYLRTVKGFWSSCTAPNAVDAGYIGGNRQRSRDRKIQLANHARFFEGFQRIIMLMSTLEGPTQSLRFVIFKYVVYGLLVLNIGLFLIFGDPHEALDSLGWVLLLGSFEYETSSADDEYSSNTEKYILLTLQFMGYALAIYATWSYWQVEQWADLINAASWLCVCAAISYDVHVPGDYGGLEWRIRNIVKGVLYTILIGVAAWWAYDAIFFDQSAHALLELYDALLWIVCFGVIELNIFATSEEEDDYATATP